MRVIGYVPEGSAPFVAEILVDENNTENLVEGQFVRFSEPFDLPDDSFVYVRDSTNYEIFSSADAQSFRSKKSQELAIEALGIKGDPIRRLELCSAAGRIMNVNLQALARRLHQSKSSPSESLSDALRRVKNDSSS